MALLSLYQLDPAPRWYQAAIQLLQTILAHFSDPSGGFFDASDDHEALIYRPKDIQDSATPSGNSLALILLLRLGAYDGNSAWRRMAEDLLSSHLGLGLCHPSAFAHWLGAADFSLSPAHEVAVVGNLSDPIAQSLLQPLWRGYYPRMVLAASPDPPHPGAPAPLNDRPLLNGKPVVYVCQNFVCKLPVNEPADMLAQLEE